MEVRSNAGEGREVHIDREWGHDAERPEQEKYP
jgi:hypothetical protein